MHKATLVSIAALAAHFASFRSVDDAIVVAVVTRELFTTVFQNVLNAACAAIVFAIRSSEPATALLAFALSRGNSLVAGLASLGCSITAFTATGRKLVVASRAVSVYLSGGEASTGGLGKLILGDRPVAICISPAQSPQTLFAVTPSRSIAVAVSASVAAYVHSHLHHRPCYGRATP